MTTSCNRSINLIDVFPDWLTGEGIFAIMEQTVVLPWAEIIDGASLDVEYFGNRSGSKPIAPLVSKLLDDTGELSEENRAKLVGAIWNRYGRNWTALYNTTIAEYNPLDNYNMTEEDTEHGNNSTTYGKTVAETVEREGINHTSVSNDNTVNRKHYGFNSTEGVPVDTDSSEGSTAGSGDETVTEDRNIKDGGMDATTITNNKTITRKGNIGVTTSQQLLQSERDLWFWNFIDSVFADVDTMLTLSVFDHSECIKIFRGGKTDYIIPVASPSVLGGVQPDAKTPNMNQPVGVDSEGRLWSQVPLATPFVRGGVQPTSQTANMTQPVGVDGAGRLWVHIPEVEEYTLPVATPSVLGGVRPNSKTEAMSQPVGVDSEGKLWVQIPEAESYELPTASPSVLGGVKPNSKTEAMSQPVGVDSEGKLWVQIPEAEEYTLPVATYTSLGGVRPNSKAATMTQIVGVDGLGRLWTFPPSTADGTRRGTVNPIAKTPNMLQPVGVDSAGKLFTGTTSYQYFIVWDGSRFKLINPFYPPMFTLTLDDADPFYFEITANPEFGGAFVYGEVEWYASMSPINQNERYGATAELSGSYVDNDGETPVFTEYMTIDSDFPVPLNHHVLDFTADGQAVNTITFYQFLDPNARLNPTTPQAPPTYVKFTFYHNL